MWGKLVRRLAQVKIDDKNRIQVPLVIRKMTDLKKTDGLVFWELEEKIVLEKLGTGTPLPGAFRQFVP